MEEGTISGKEESEEYAPSKQGRKCGTCHLPKYCLPSNKRLNEIPSSSRANFEHKCSNIPCLDWNSCPTKYRQVFSFYFNQRGTKKNSTESKRSKRESGKKKNPKKTQ